MASSQQVQGSIGKLPEELRLQVCDLLPVPTLKSLGLANKLWRKSTSTVLWKSFNSNLQDTRIRKFDALLMSLPNGFLDNVENLKITTQASTSEKVMQLISLLASNTLRTVDLTTVNARTLGLLIRSQTLIEHLIYRRIGSNAEHVSPDPRFLAGNLKKLRKLTITPLSDTDDYSAWLLNTPALESLELIPRSGVTPDVADWISLKIWKPPVGFLPLRLRRLSLTCLNLANHPEPLGKIIRLSSLESLVIRNCINVSRLLRHLSNVFAALDESALKSLRVTQPYHDPDLLESLNLFIGCFSGLEWLFVATRDPERIEVDKICRHGKTLRFLHLDPLYRHAPLALSEAGNNYTAMELGTLVTGCPRIEELGIHAAVIDISSFLRSGAQFSISERGNVTKALDVLARLPSLRSLRFTHLLALAENTEIENEHLHATRYNQLASEVMHYLVERGSRIEVYSTSPTIVPGDFEMEKDCQGHTWPHYFYVRGTLTLPRRDRHHVQVQAIGVTKETIEDYVRYPNILFRSEQTNFDL